MPLPHETPPQESGPESPKVELELAGLPRERDKPLLRFAWCGWVLTGIVGLSYLGPAKFVWFLINIPQLFADFDAPSLAFVVLFRILVIPTLYLAVGVSLLRRTLTGQRARKALRSGELVVFLRSFARERDAVQARYAAPSHWLWSMLWGSRTPESQAFDVWLAPWIESIAPMVALGNPRDWLPSDGARKLYPEDADWQQLVGTLLRKSRVVLIQAGASSGLDWELDYLRQNVPPRKVFVLLEPGVRDATRWEALRSRFAGQGWNLPELAPEPGALIAFSETRHGRFLRERLVHPDDYTRAISNALASGNASRIFNTVDKHALVAWKRSLLTNVFSGGLSGCLLVLTTLAFTLYAAYSIIEPIVRSLLRQGVEMQSRVGDGNRPGMTILAIPAVALGFLFFQLVAPMFYRLHRLMNHTQGTEQNPPSSGPDGA
ncbi:hypothetical protein JY651_23255 [Pyxidicoccus parkwayensis]|uniref:Uncharacterized protein n=1 Tax=Pyxidicoccus parkwayensis TaxID=2813578 RepID=A0ABX7PB21_9BACT|nr:hypothetical protein [Pyxidicoccus parkwaysis]QSQ27648.1 hypothetical protein JY651_23255 [Pyxidicoccus parkwaysis]